MKKYDHLAELLVDIKDGKLDAILNCENSHKDLIQLHVEVKPERLSHKGEVKNYTLCVLTKIVQRNSSDIWARIVENLINFFENHQQHGSGWFITGIGNMYVDN